MTRAVLLALLLGMATLAAAQSAQRLILTDGSWQEIADYRIVGDRVQYLSAIRKDWEQVPESLVDWKATREWNARLTQPALPLQGSGAGAAADTSLAVAPGLELPAAGGIFLLDSYSGQPSLVELVQVRGVLRHSTSGLFHLPKAPGAPTQDRLELRGVHARSQSHVLAPLLYLKISSSGEGMPVPVAERYRIARLESEADKGMRVFGNGKAADRQPGAPGPLVAVHVTTFQQGWLRVVPKENLTPGEYALVEILPGDRLNSYVWDFGVDPQAPDNPNSRKPYSVEGAGAPQSGESAPKLEKREPAASGDSH